MSSQAHPCCCSKGRSKWITEEARCFRAKFRPGSSDRDTGRARSDLRVWYSMCKSSDSWYQPLQWKTYGPTLQMFKVCYLYFLSGDPRDTQVRTRKCKSSRWTEGARRPGAGPWGEQARSAQTVYGRHPHYHPARDWKWDPERWWSQCDLDQRISWCWEICISS